MHFLIFGRILDVKSGNVDYRVVGRKGVFILCRLELYVYMKKATL